MNYQEKLFRQSHGFECYPVALAWAALAVSAIGTGASLVQQKRNQDATEDYQKEVVKSNNTAEHYKQSQLRQQEAQAAESAARESEKARLAAQAGKSTAVAGLGDRGGNTVDALLAEHDMALGSYREAILRQSQLNEQGVGSGISASVMNNATTNRSYNAPVAGPNYAAAAVSLAGDALGTYKDYGGFTKKTNVPATTNNVPLYLRKPSGSSSKSPFTLSGN